MHIMDLNNHEPVYFIDEQYNRFSACSDCDKKDLESTLRCLVPNLQAFRRDVNFYVVGYRQVEILVGHLFRRILSRIEPEAYEERIEEIIQYINRLYVTTIACNNNERDSDYNAEYANRHRMLDHQRDYIERFVVKQHCHCEDRSLKPKYRNSRGEIVWSFR